MAPSGWPSGLPPISLITFIAVLVILIVKRRSVLERRAIQETSREASQALEQPDSTED